MRADDSGGVSCGLRPPGPLGRSTHVVLLLAACLSTSLFAADASAPFAITVVDDQTNRGVPLVELRTVNDIRCFTDSNGIVAFNEPGLMNQKVYFNIKSDGYDAGKDGFGYRGAALEVKPGGSATIKLKRLNIAERLYRITGQGIYRDSVLVGAPVPLKEPVLNAQVLGQDSVQMAEYHGKLFWTWGDTNKASYPLGHFGTSGATSLPPGKGGLDPAKGVDLTYFTDPNGFSRPMCGAKGDGMKWMDALVVIKDGGTERLLSRFARHKSLGEVHERGWTLFNDKAEVFDPISVWAMDEFWIPLCHAFQHQGFIYFTWPYPFLRVKPDVNAIKDPHAYEAFTCLAPGSRYAKGAAKLERDANGKLVWAWKVNTAPLMADQQRELIASGAMKADEAWYRFTDAETGKPVQAHAGSVAFNEFRKRWIMIFHADYGKPSLLGEVYYAESETLEGPWTTCRKIVTHEKYTFYNVKHHPLFDQDGGRVIYLEGTYTAMFSGVTDPTPRYDYNQVMYRLDLADARLKLPPAK